MGLVFPIMGLVILIQDLVVWALIQKVQSVDQAQNNKRGDPGESTVVNRGIKKILAGTCMENRRIGSHDRIIEIEAIKLQLTINPQTSILNR